MNSNQTLIKIEVNRMIADLKSFIKNAERLEADSGIETISNHSIFQIHEKESFEKIAKAFDAQIQDRTFIVQSKPWIEGSIVIDGIKIFVMYEPEEVEK